MIPRSTSISFDPYTPETSSKTGVLRGYDQDEESKPKSDFDISRIGKNDFMKLLLAQMTNQNPLDPAGNTEFVAQLAQFSSLEKMTQMNMNLEKTLENNTLMAEAINNAMLISYFGKSVNAESDSFYYDGENPVEIMFTLDSDVLSGSLEILNGDGKSIRALPLDTFKSGKNTLDWDGITKNGTHAFPGVYSFKIDAYDILNNRIESTPMFSGVVDGISYRDGKAQLTVGNVLIPFDRVKQIKESE